MFLHVSVCPQDGGGGGIPACLAAGLLGGEGWWYPSMPCRWYPSMPCRSPGGSPGPHPRGKLRGLASGGSLGPHPWEEVEVSGQGEVSRPTPRESPGPHLGGLQAHTQGGLQAHTWAVSQHALRQTPSPPWMATADGYCRGQ